MLGEWNHGQGQEKAGPTGKEITLHPGLSTGLHPVGGRQKKSNSLFGAQTWRIKLILVLLVLLLDTSC